MNNPIYYDVSLFSEFDVYLFKEGTHFKLYKHLGAHLLEREGKSGTYFALWAPNATGVSVRGDFNNYDIYSHKLHKREDNSGIWEGFIEGVNAGTTYKYHIQTKTKNANADKSDPFAFYAEVAPSSASRVWDIENFEWNDKAWMKGRKKQFA